jgi:hypothetical protein
MVWSNATGIPHHHPPSRPKTLAHYTHQLQISHQAFGSFGTDINYSKGQRYLGGFIGSAVKKEEWLVGIVEKWVADVVTLSTVAERYP